MWHSALTLYGHAEGKAAQMPLVVELVKKMQCAILSQITYGLDNNLTPMTAYIDSAASSSSNACISFTILAIVQSRTKL